jgi:uncharacterized membrane protein YiaA
MKRPPRATATVVSALRAGAYFIAVLVMSTLGVFAVGETTRKSHMPPTP